MPITDRGDLNEAEFTLLISDRWQKQGFGTELLKRLVQIGRDEKLNRIFAHIPPDNHAMIHVSKEIGFKIEHDADNQGSTAEYVL